MDLSYTQNLEDYHLSLAFAGQTTGKYIDIGAGHPIADNVSFWFYERGWQGIVVEPQSELAALYERLRPRDITVRGLVGRECGEIDFHVVDRLHGFSTTRDGAPLDGYGRVLYLDTYDSAYGPGWRRENGFVARNRTGMFCYGFVPHRSLSGTQLPPGNGVRYRLSTSGPGVTPDVAWVGPALHDYDPSSAADRALEARMNVLQAKLAGRSKPCHS